MARLTPGEIMESPEERESALQKQVRSLKAKLKRRDKKIKELKTGKGWRRYGVGNGLNNTLTGDIEFVHFEGQIENGVSIAFRGAKLDNVVFQVDHDDVLVFVNCTFKDVHFTAQPRFIFMEGCTVPSKGVTTEDPADWRISNEKYGWTRTPPELLDNLQQRDTGDFEQLL